MSRVSMDAIARAREAESGSSEAVEVVENSPAPVVPKAQAAKKKPASKKKARTKRA